MGTGMPVSHRMRTMSRYLEIKAMSIEQRKFKDVVPRVVIFAGKAAPGYLMAKNIIKV